MFGSTPAFALAEFVSIIELDWDGLTEISCASSKMTFPQKAQGSTVILCAFPVLRIGTLGYMDVIKIGNRFWEQVWTCGVCGWTKPGQTMGGGNL